MVTGDNILTAISVGRDCELIREGAREREDGPGVNVVDTGPFRWNI